MSLSFPSLVLPKGLGWNFIKAPKFMTEDQIPQSLRHPASYSLQQSVLYDLELNFNYLKNRGVTFTDDANYLMNFYEACRGRLQWFTLDPNQFNLAAMSVTQDYSQLVNGFSGLTDGVTTAFPLWRSTTALGAGNVTLCEAIQNVTGLYGVYLNGVLQSTSAYTLTNFPATITFTSAPAASLNLAWAGTYSYLCRFAADVLSFNEFMYQLWELKSCKLETVLV